MPDFGDLLTANTVPGIGGGTPGGLGAAPGAAPTGTLDAALKAAYARSIAESQNPMYRFGSALSGQNPDAALGPIQDALLKQQQLQQGSRGLDIRQQQADTQGKAVEAQLQQIRGAMIKEGIDTIKAVQSLGLEGDVADKIHGALAPQLEKLFRFGAAGTPEADLVSGDLVKEALKDPGTIKTYLDSVPMLTDAQKKVLGQLSRTQGAKVMLDEMKNISAQNMEAGVQSSREKFGALPESPQPRSLVQAMRDAKLSQLERNAVFAMLATGKGDAELAEFNILPPSIKLAGAKSAAEAAGSESTPGGQAKVALTQAQTGHAAAQTAQVQQDTATGKVVPYQEGGGVLAVLPGQVQTLQPAGQKPPSTAERDLMASGEASSKQFVDLIAQAKKDPTRYFGPKAGAISGAKSAGEAVGLGKSDADVEKFWANVEITRASYLRALEGARVPVAAREAFAGFFPKRGVTPSTKAIAALEAAKERGDSLLAERKKEFGRGGTTAGGGRYRYNVETGKLDPVP